MKSGCLSVVKQVALTALGLVVTRVLAHLLERKMRVQLVLSWAFQYVYLGRVSRACERDPQPVAVCVPKVRVVYDHRDVEATALELVARVGVGIVKVVTDVVQRVTLAVRLTLTLILKPDVTVVNTRYLDLKAPFYLVILLAASDLDQRQPLKVFGLGAVDLLVHIVNHVQPVCYSNGVFRGFAFVSVLGAQLSDTQFQFPEVPVHLFDARNMFGLEPLRLHQLNVNGEHLVEQAVKVGQFVGLVAVPVVFNGDYLLGVACRDKLGVRVALRVVAEHSPMYVIPLSYLFQNHHVIPGSSATPQVFLGRYLARQLVQRLTKVDVSGLKVGRTGHGTALVLAHTFDVVKDQRGLARPWHWAFDQYQPVGLQYVVKYA